MTVSNNTKFRKSAFTTNQKNNSMELSKNRTQKLGKKIKRCQLIISQENSELEFSDCPELV